MALSPVMINSPWQADDDADNQSGNNRSDSAHTSISLTVPPASLNFAIRLSALCSDDHNQRPAVKPRYCCNGRLPDGYHHDQSWWRHTHPICCNATASDFSERSLSGQAACGRHPTSRKEAGSVRRLLIWVLGLAWQVCEGDRSNQ